MVQVKVLKPEKTFSDIIDEDDDDNNLSTSSVDEDSDMWVIKHWNE